MYYYVYIIKHIYMQCCDICICNDIWNDIYNYIYIVLASSHFVRKLVSHPQANIWACRRLKFSIQQKRHGSWSFSRFQFALREMSPKQCHEMTGPDVIFSRIWAKFGSYKTLRPSKHRPFKKWQDSLGTSRYKWFLSLYKWTLKWNMRPTMSYWKCAQGYIKYIYIVICIYIYYIYICIYIV